MLFSVTENTKPLFYIEKNKVKKMLSDINISIITRG